MTTLKWKTGREAPHLTAEDELRVVRANLGAEEILRRLVEAEALRAALGRIVRMEDGQYEPGDTVEMRDGHGFYWTGTIVRENDTTYTVTRHQDGQNRRWEKEGVYPHKMMWDEARAALAQATEED